MLIDNCNRKSFDNRMIKPRVNSMLVPRSMTQLTVQEIALTFRRYWDKSGEWGLVKVLKKNNSNHIEDLCNRLV